MVVYCKTLVQTIPVHFDFEGKADNFGSKKYAFWQRFIHFYWNF
ncbi:DUF1648 domain-containing protein [Chryseobacterium taeanense]